MPTREERRYYSMGFQDGRESVLGMPGGVKGKAVQLYGEGGIRSDPPRKKKLSAWQKFVKVNSKKPRFRYKSGSKKGKINLKALGVAYRKKRR